MSVVNKRLSIISDQVDQDLEKACSIIKEAGYTSIELHNVFNKTIEECNEQEVEQILTILNKYDLRVSNIASTIFFLCPLYEHYRVSLFNPAFHAIEGNIEDHLKALKRACEIAEKLNCKTIRIFPFRSPDNEDIEVVGTRKDMNKIIEIFKRALQVVRPYDVTLVVENCPYSHCPKGEMTLQIVREMNDKQCKLLWDSANSYRAQIHKVPSEYLTLSLTEEYQLIKKDIAHLHLKNYSFVKGLEKPFVHKSLLEGDIAYLPFIECFMKEQNCSLSLEPEVDYQETLRSMQELKESVRGII
ncbi:MAG: TIM barrel protein [Anaerorhabdus sp.]